MASSKNILLLIPNLDFGGAQNSFSKLSIELGKFSKVTNVVFNKDQMADYNLAGALIDLGIGRSSHFWGKLLNFLKRIYKLKRVKKFYKIDTSISFLEGADYVNILSRYKKEEKIILNVRGTKKYDQNISGVVGFLRHQFLLPWLYNRADHIVTVNNGVRDELLNMYQITKPISVIYNGFSLIGPEQLEANLVIDDLDVIFRNQVIISHGRLAIEKGYHHFIEAYSQVVKSGIRCKLVLMGDGPEKNNLINACRSLGLITWQKSEELLNQNADVFFLGYQSDPYRYLRQASFFVLPSHHEGFGNSLAEAMLCGLPVLATDCPYGPREILSLSSTTVELDIAEWASFGVLLPKWGKPNVLEQWIMVMTKMLYDNKLAAHYAGKAKERISYFSVAKMMKTWNDLI